MKTLCLCICGLFSVANSFPVDNVTMATGPLSRAEWVESVEAHCGRPMDLEAFSRPKDDLIVTKSGCKPTHGFVAAIHLAYSQHYPLEISPDDIWLCIVQGFAAHVNANPEKLRHYFVEFEGKKTIKVERDDFVKGSPNNPWPEVFTEFSTQIRSHIGNKTHDLLVPTFTTTGPTQKAAAEIVLMDAFKNYFKYIVQTWCGIPEIVLRGSVDDWKNLRERTLGLAQFELQWWIDALEPILDELVATSEGRVNQTFWSNIYKVYGGSGGPYISGWILKLFPYYRKSWGKGEYYFKRDFDNSEFMIKSNSLPPGVSQVPFTWEYYLDEIPMDFYAGFMGVTQDPNSLIISTEVGWAVAERPSSENS